MPYQPYQIQGTEGLLSGLNQEQQNFVGASGFDIASQFGFKKADKYAEFFQPIDLSQAQEGLSSLPQLRNYQYGQARQGFNQQQSQLNTRIGQTGFSNTGSFGGLLGQLQSGFENQLFNIDKGIQSLYSGYQDEISNQIANLYQTASGILGSGAKVTGSSKPKYTIDKYGSDFDAFQTDLEAWLGKYGGQ